MKNRKQKKSGFTLVELMVVAIIVAILAAVAVPMMSRSQIEKALQTEGQQACSAIATQARIYYTENNAMPGEFDELSSYVTKADLQGTYFDFFTFSATDNNNYVITAVGKTGSKAAGKTLTMTVTDGAASFSFGDTPPAED